MNHESNGHDHRNGHNHHNGHDLFNGHDHRSDPAEVADDGRTNTPTADHHDAAFYHESAAFHHRQAAKLLASGQTTEANLHALAAYRDNLYAHVSSHRAFKALNVDGIENSFLQSEVEAKLKESRDRTQPPRA